MDISQPWPMAASDKKNVLCTQVLYLNLPQSTSYINNGSCDYVTNESDEPTDSADRSLNFSSVVPADLASIGSPFWFYSP